MGFIRLLLVEKKIALINIFSNAIGHKGMLAGQFLDLEAEKLLLDIVSAISKLPLFINPMPLKKSELIFGSFVSCHISHISNISHNWNDYRSGNSYLLNTLPLSPILS